MIKIKTRQDQFAYQDFVAYVLRHGLYVKLVPNDSALTIIVEDKSEAEEMGKLLASYSGAKRGVDTMAPCKDCKDRFYGCHDTCEKYIAFTRARQKYNQERWEEVEIKSYCYDTLRKERKRH